MNNDKPGLTESSLVYNYSGRTWPRLAKQQEHLRRKIKSVNPNGFIQTIKNTLFPPPTANNNFPFGLDPARWPGQPPLRPLRASNRPPIVLPALRQPRVPNNAPFPPTPNNSNMNNLSMRNNSATKKLIVGNLPESPRNLPESPTNNASSVNTYNTNTNGNRSPKSRRSRKGGKQRRKTRRN